MIDNCIDVTACNFHADDGNGTCIYSGIYYFDFDGDIELTNIELTTRSFFEAPNLSVFNSAYGRDTRTNQRIIIAQPTVAGQPVRVYISQEMQQEFDRDWVTRFFFSYRCPYHNNFLSFEFTY